MEVAVSYNSALKKVWVVAFLLFIYDYVANKQSMLSLLCLKAPEWHHSMRLLHILILFGGYYIRNVKIHCFPEYTIFKQFTFLFIKSTIFQGNLIIYQP